MRLKQQVTPKVNQRMYASDLAINGLFTLELWSNLIHPDRHREAIHEELYDEARTDNEV